MEFVAGVAGDVERDRPKHEQSESERVDRHRQRDEREDAGLDDGFDRAEAIGRPWAGVVALMVHAMDQPEEPRVVDEPVRPIEVGVVYENHDDDAAPEPAPSVILDVAVDERPAGLGERERGRADESVDDDGESRPLGLAAQVRSRRHRRDDLAARPPVAEEHVAQEPCASCEHQIVRQVVRRDERDHLPETRKFLRERPGGEGHAHAPSSARRPASSRMATPSSWALVSFEPASSPATT